MRNIFLIYIIAFFLFLFSCNSNEPDGGPCTYDKKIYPATVIGIVKKDSLVADIIFRVNDLSGNIYRDSVLWSMGKKELMPLTMIEKDSMLLAKNTATMLGKLLMDIVTQESNHLKL